MPETFRSISSAYAAARSGAALDYATQLIRESLRAVVPVLTSAVVLDLGCGYSNLSFAEWLPCAAKVVGVDRRQEAVKRHPHLDFRIVGDIENSPLVDGSVDVVISSFVMEHVEDPKAVLRECQRVLKPNGIAIFLTPCLFGYKTLVARLSGDRLSNLIWKILKGKPHPPWPDYYRANTPGKIRSLCALSGLVLERLVFIPELPHFFYNSPLLFAGARAWDQILEFAHLPMLHNGMAYALRRPAAAAGQTVRGES
ncbi:MAG: class I SAM-dependent methyltransferase [Candidatus Sulfotelmatobacter sp.]